MDADRQRLGLIVVTCAVIVVALKYSDDAFTAIESHIDRGQRLRKWLRRNNASEPRLKTSLLERNERIQAAVRVLEQTAGSDVLLGLKDEPERQRRRPAYIQLAQGGLLLTGGAASGRTYAMAAVAINFVNANPRCQLVSVDCGGGELDRLLPSASLALTGPDKGSITHLLNQLDEDYRRPTAPLLVVIDRIDIVQDVLPNVIQLSRHIAGGGRNSVFVVASSDSRLPLDPEIRRSFRFHQELLDEYVGISRDGDGGGSLVQVTDPTKVLLQRDHLVLPPGGSWLDRFPVDRTQPTSTNGLWRPLGRPDGQRFTSLVTDMNQRGVAIGVDEVRHESLQILIGNGLGIIGQSGPGKTTGC